MASTKNSAHAVEDIQRDVQALRKDLSLLLQQMGGLVEQSGNDAAGAVKEQIRRMQEGLEDVASNAAERGAEAFNGISERVTDGLEEAVNKHPISTIAIAAGLGYLLGAVSTRR